MKTSEEVAGGLFVTGCNAPEVFDGIEEAFNEIAFGIECEVAFAFDLAVCLWWNDWPDRAHPKASDEAVGIVSLVGDEGLRLDLSRQRFGLCDVADLTACQADRQRIPQGIDDGMNLRRKTTTRTAYGLVAAPFLRAPALC